MKFRHLKNILNNLTGEELDNDLVVYCRFTDEYVPATLEYNNGETDVLDEGHPVIVTN